LEEKIEEDKVIRNMDRGQLIKRKKTSTCALENLVGRKERQAGEAMKMRVKWT
jgi:hypothetical protein